MVMQGKVVVITGATSGIGEVAAQKLAAMGARIVMIARNRDRAAMTLSGLRQIARESNIGSTMLIFRGRAM